MQQDWKPVIFKKKPNTQQIGKQKTKPSGKRINIGDKLRKLDNTEIDKINRVSLNTSKAISKTRTGLKMSQKELAQKINEKPELISQYETGKAVPQQHIILKLERALGVYLTGSKVGEPKVRKTKSSCK